MEGISLNQTKIYDLRVAQEKLIHALVNCGFELKDIIPINNKRYAIIRGNKKSILFTFKRDHFITFGEMFKEYGKEGVGDTINQEELDTAIRMQVTDIISVFSDGIAYTIPIVEFLEKSIQWTPREGKEVRSISITDYKKLFNLEDE